MRYAKKDYFKAIVYLQHVVDVVKDNKLAHLKFSEELKIITEYYNQYFREDLDLTDDGAYSEAEEAFIQALINSKILMSKMVRYIRLGYKWLMSNTIDSRETFENKYSTSREQNTLDYYLFERRDFLIDNKRVIKTKL